MDEIVARSEICFPDVLVEYEVQHDVEEFQESLSKQGVSIQRYLQQVGKTEEEFLEQLRAEAARRVQIGLALGEIAEKENITATDEEVDAEIERIAADSKATKESVETYIEARGGRSTFKNSLINRKIMDFLRSVSTIK